MKLLKSNIVFTILIIIFVIGGKKLIVQDSEMEFRNLILNEKSILEYMGGEFTIDKHNYTISRDFFSSGMEGSFSLHNEKRKVQIDGVFVKENKHTKFCSYTLWEDGDKLSRALLNCE